MLLCSCYYYTSRNSRHFLSPMCIFCAHYPLYLHNELSGDEDEDEDEDDDDDGGGGDDDDDDDVAYKDPQQMDLSGCPILLTG